jgi:hypothetical protein
MRKNIRGLALLALAYIAFWPVEYSVAQDQPRARELSRSGPVRVFRKRESPVLFSQEGEVRFQKAYVDQNGSIRADGHNLDLYGAVLIRRDRICTSAEGARWTCGQRAYMTLRALLAERPITCSFKPISVPPKAVCSVDDQDIAQLLLREGWAELPNSDRNSTRITIDHGRPGGPLNRGRPGAPNVLPRAALHTGCQHLRLGPICIACSRVLGQRGLSRNRAIYFAIKRAGNQVSSMSGRGLMELL